jgi:2-polyprenyl-6-methoxyphenol hydroxylase-like FAD-dependent oxidoreductase
MSEPAFMHNGSVLVSGAGVAGLAVAYWLGRYGFKSTLIGRSPRFEPGEYLLDLSGRGYDVAEKMGLLSDLESRGYHLREFLFVDAGGHRVGEVNEEVISSITHDRYISIPHNELARLLYQKTETHCEMLFDDSITCIEPEQGSIRVSFVNRQPRLFDLLIGADGLHSPVRKLVFGNESQFTKFLGYAVAVFEVKGYRPRDEGICVSFTTPGKQVARFALRDDHTMFWLVFSPDRPVQMNALDMESQKKLIHAEFDREGWECPHILAALDNCTHVHFDNVSQIRMNTWSSGRAVLVGDAAFGSSILAEQGSELALIGAYVLAGELAKAEEVPELGFENYERLLRSFVMDQQELAEQFIHLLVPKTLVGLLLRNQLTKAISPRLLKRIILEKTVNARFDVPDYSRFNRVDGRYRDPS